MRLDFKDRHVVVTGAGGELGAAVAELLVQQGAICHLPLRRALDSARSNRGGAGRIEVKLGVDLTREEAVRSFYAELSDLWASIHCAGGFSMGPIEETSLDQFSALFSTNCVSAFLCCREAARNLRQARGPGRGPRGGRIVNVAARPALEPRTGSGMVAYTASKAALAALTSALAEELAAEEVWVNAVAPSILNTPANRAAMPQADPSRWPTVEEVAATIAFLASPENRSTRGAVVPVYGRN